MLLKSGFTNKTNKSIRQYNNIRKWKEFRPEVNTKNGDEDGTKRTTNKNNVK